MLVHFWETRDTASGVRVPIVGRLRFRATSSRVLVGTPDEEVLPAPFSVALDADGKADVTLPATGLSWAWAWEVSLYGDDAGWGPFYVAVGAGAEADWPDLVRVDPATLVPTQAAVPAWDAAVSAVEGYAQAAADSAALAAGSAEHVGETVAAEVQDWLAANPPTAGDDGREVELQTTATHVQWRYVGDVAWLDLIPLATLTGATGAPPELQATATAIQWRAPGGAWADLVTLAALKGGVGDAGPSAYAVAVANGFVGSEAAWLASLKGDDGDPAPLPAFTASATTGAPGTAAAATVSGTYPDLTLDLTIPEGEQGVQGDEGPSGQAGSYVGVTTIPDATYAPIVTDVGKLLRFTSATPVTVTLPADADAAIPVGKTIDFAQRGAGSITFVPGAGVSPLIVADTAVTRKLGSMATAIKEGANLWSVVGDLA